MISILLAVFAVAMLVASAGHVLALFRRERALSEMHAALAVAGRPHGDRLDRRGAGEDEGPSGEHPINREVLIGRPLELRQASGASRDPEVGGPGKRSVKRVTV